MRDTTFILYFKTVSGYFFKGFFRNVVALVMEAVPQDVIALI